MTTYRKIHGRAIKSVSTNLSVPSAEGQIWFNTTDNKFKTIVSAGAWVSSAAASNGRSSPQGFGTQTAAVMAGGQTGPGNQSYVEECKWIVTGKL